MKYLVDWHFLAFVYRVPTFYETLKVERISKIENLVGTSKIEREIERERERDRQGERQRDNLDKCSIFPFKIILLRS